MDLELALKEAELAYHKLVTGRQTVEFRDQNGEVVRYQAANLARLAAYINQLKGQINPCAVSGPMMVIF